MLLNHSLPLYPLSTDRIGRASRKINARRQGTKFREYVAEPMFRQHLPAPSPLQPSKHTPILAVHASTNKSLTRQISEQNTSSSSSRVKNNNLLQAYVIRRTDNQKDQLDKISPRTLKALNMYQLKFFCIF